MWKMMNTFEKQALFQEKKALWKRVPEYFWKEGELVLQPGCVSLDRSEKEVKKNLDFAHIM